MTEFSAQQAKTIIEGIRDLGCKLMQVDPKPYRVMLGGSVHSSSAVIDWYFSDQNVDAYVNSKKAYESGLIRRTYGIFRGGPSALVVLRVLEWSAQIDNGTSEYRTIWTKPVDEMGAKKEMASYFADSFLSRTNQPTKSAD